MKTRSHLTATGTSAHSRRTARLFLSRDWLDRPLPTSTVPTRPPLSAPLGVAFTGKVVAR